MSYSAKLIKNTVEVDQDFTLCNFRNVVHGLAGVVSHTSVLICEASQNWRNDFGKIAGKILSLCLAILRLK